jgi:hypothetical protein
VRDRELSPLAKAAWQRLDPREARAVAAVIAEMLDERVPLVRDGDFAAPHGASIVARPVEGTDLAVYYVPAGDVVFVVNIVRLPANR